MKVRLLISFCVAEQVSALISEKPFMPTVKPDFIAKLQIALKECSESEYWIELLMESGYYKETALLDQCIEIKRMLISSINTAKKNK